MEHSRDHRHEEVLHRTTSEHGPGTEAVDTARHARSSHVGHDKHAGHSVEMFRDRFWISLALTILALIWDPMIQDWFGYRAPVFPGSQYIPAVFGTAVFVYGGRVFLEGAVRELADRLPGMMTLIGLAISVAFFYSAAVTLDVAPHPLGFRLCFGLGRLHRCIFLLGVVGVARGLSPLALPKTIRARHTTFAAVLRPATNRSSRNRSSVVIVMSVLMRPACMICRAMGIHCQ